MYEANEICAQSQSTASRERPAASARACAASPSSHVATEAVPASTRETVTCETVTWDTLIPVFIFTETPRRRAKRHAELRIWTCPRTVDPDGGEQWIFDRWLGTDSEATHCIATLCVFQKKSLAAEYPYSARLEVVSVTYRFTGSTLNVRTECSS